MMTELDIVQLKQRVERALTVDPWTPIRVDPRQLLDLLRLLDDLQHPAPVRLDKPKLLQARNTVESFDFECNDCGYMFADPPFIKDGQTLCYVCAGEDIP